MVEIDEEYKSWTIMFEIWRVELHSKGPSYGEVIIDRREVSKEERDKIEKAMRKILDCSQ